MRTKPRKAVQPQESLGERIRRFRKLKGLTQTDLARHVGISSRMMAYYEIQGGSPSSELLKKLAMTLGVSMDVLAGRETSKKIPESPDFRLWHRVKRIQELPLHDRKAVLKMIDAMANEARRRKAS